MRTSDNVQMLLDVENSSPELLFERVPGLDIPVWALLRQLLAQAAANIELGTVPMSTSGAQALVSLARDLVPNRFSHRYAKTQRDFLYLVSGATVTSTPEGLRNWLTDDFAGQFADRTAVVQNRPLRGRTRSERPVFSNTFSYADAQSRIEFPSRLAPLPQRSQRLVRDIVRELIELFPFDLTPETVRSLERRTLHRVGRARYDSAAFERLLHRIRPRYVFMEDASYGGRAHQIRILKKQEIPVIELQHGWVGPYHTAYNFGSAMFTPPLADCLPDVLLTFGDFWSRNIRHPARTVAIGKPHLESSSRRAKLPGSKANEVLVISSVYRRDALSDFVESLRRALPSDWTVRLRPHPSERPTVESLYPRLSGQTGIEFDLESDVASSLIRAKGVFGYSSTVLYEALAFRCHVSVIDSPVADFSGDIETFGERIEDSESLLRAVERLVRNDEGAEHRHLNEIWKPDAVGSFRAFVNSL